MGHAAEGQQENKLAIQVPDTHPDRQPGRQGRQQADGQTHAWIDPQTDDRQTE